MRYSVKTLVGESVTAYLAKSPVYFDLNTAFSGKLYGAHFLEGSQLIPAYGRRDLLETIRVKRGSSRAYEVKGAIVAGHRFVVFDREFAVYNDFRGRDLRLPERYHEPMFQTDENGQLWLGNGNGPIEQLSGRYALVYWDAGQMYHHWLFECLTRVSILASDRRFSDVKFLVPETAGRFVADSMAFLGIDPHRIVAFNPLRLYEIESLIILPVPSFEADNCEPGYLSRLRVDILARLNLSPYTSTPDKIVFTRRDALKGERQLLNERALVKRLTAKGFTPIDPGEYSFADQVRLTYQAKQVLCVHGSAGANLLFCKPRAKVLHLFPDCVHYFRTHGIGSAVAETTYAYVFGPSFERNNRHHNNPWLLDPDRVIDSLRRISIYPLKYLPNVFKIH